MALRLRCVCTTLVRMKLFRWALTKAALAGDMGYCLYSGAQGPGMDGHVAGDDRMRLIVVFPRQIRSSNHPNTQV